MFFPLRNGTDKETIAPMGGQQKSNSSNLDRNIGYTCEVKFLLFALYQIYMAKNYIDIPKETGKPQW